MMKRVVVAMSGGVDSSVAAHLLKEEGFEVIGATMRIWKDGDQNTPYGCCGALAVEDARHVAQKLGIPFYVFNLEEDFEKEVIQYFCEEYGRGKTPNPCILCNEKIKFKAFLRKALDLEADFIATGHYARLEFDGKTNRYLLKKGKDRKKDQSYVLFSLTQDQLSRTLFPLGNILKEEVRKIAFELGLRVHDKPESQEICFIHEHSYHAFLQERLKGSIEPGPFVDQRGNILGIHKGIPFYTIGQRRGLGVAKGVPLYVTRIDREKNQIILGEKNEVYADCLIVESVLWIRIPSSAPSFSAQVKIRYNHPGSEAILSLQGNSIVMVKFKSPQKAITPGQAAVFYDEDTVIGGGWIKEAIRPRLEFESLPIPGQSPSHE
jgi:tRNA-uridine 2-sulfurtransferase